MIALEAATHTALSISPNRHNFLRALAAAAAVGHSFFGLASMDETGPGAGEKASFNSLHPASHRPQTLYGIEDSPVGLAAWMLDHDAASEALIAPVFDSQSEGLTRDDVLENVTLYWWTNTAVSSARQYWESKLSFFPPKHVAIPVAVSVFPDEVYATAKSWAEKAYPKLIHYNRLPKGGHFAAWEQPALFSDELRVSFRSPRQ
jgi:pimeloyl-ACP methyl ester carboxylesterase